MTAKLNPDPLAYPPRGLSRDAAARYIGVGTSLFDKMVADGRMPRPKIINTRKVWDRLAIDLAFSSLPDSQADRDGQEHENVLDRLLARGGRIS